MAPLLSLALMTPEKTIQALQPAPQVVRVVFDPPSIYSLASAAWSKLKSVP